LQDFVGSLVTDASGKLLRLDAFCALIADPSKSKWLQPLFDYFLDIRVPPRKSDPYGTSETVVPLTDTLPHLARALDELAALKVDTSWRRC
jgi:hypothetical protein